MCEFCIKHGEGEKWYLQAKNYSDELLNDVYRKKFTEEFFTWIKHTYDSKFRFLRMGIFKLPGAKDVFQKVLRGWLKYKHWGQVVPLEDVYEIFNMTNSITRVPCICRKVISGKERRVCFLISLNPSNAGIAHVVDQSFFGGPDVAKFEIVTKEQAFNQVRECEDLGMIHTVWTFKAPFIGGLCNCDYASGCFPMKMYKESSPVVFRAEYVAMVNSDSCSGCKACVEICPFDAIMPDAIQKKATISLQKCYGCGICRSFCKKNAINLISRGSMHETAKLWYG